MNNNLSIRPEARLIKSIGKDLIKDYYAAVVELVKNAYDADSDSVEITLSLEKEKIYDKEEEFLKFTIKDTGVGMSLDVIKNAWMVPATSYKLNKKESKKGRQFQGRKGIGRYASAILGDFLRMKTTDIKGVTTTIEIDWKQFENTDSEVKYLDEIYINYENKKTDLSHGTKIEIYSPIIIDSNLEKKISWTRKDYDNLLKELRNLLSPLEKDKDDEFEIKLVYNNLESFSFDNISIIIEPFPLLELYDYRISGKIDSNGKGTLLYENQNFLDSKENIDFTVPIVTKDKQCGDIKIDLRFFDLEPEAIQALINRGLKDPITNDYLGRSEARNMIKEYAGIGIYRDLFRIRPYGDANYDWLGLNQKRINNPSVKVSTNQVVGFINIESEEESLLVEKSAREGLKENENYETLKQVLSKVISEVESRRYKFRKNTKRGRKAANNIKDAISELFSFDNVSHKVRTLLEKSGMENSLIVKIEKTLKDEEKSKEKELKSIQDTLVMYEAHAALGRLVQLVIHEGRKPLQFLNANLNNLEKDIKYFIKNPNDDEVKKDLVDFIMDNKSHVKTISTLFSNLDPLMAKRLTRKKEFNLCKNIDKNSNFFKNQFKEKNIDFKIECEKILFYGREEDFFIVYTNLIENSIYWLKNIDKKEIYVNIYKKKNEIFIDYKDTGVGIEDKFASEIFDAGFSQKPEGGTGIGLTLVGQAISRNNGTIECIKSNKGAFFRITLKGKKENE